MAGRDEDSFRPKLAPPRSRGGSKTPRFVTRVLTAASRAGPSGVSWLSGSTSRSGVRLGRGRVAAKLAGSALRADARRVVIKARLVNLAKARPRSASTHLRYIERDGVMKDGSAGRAYGADTDEADTASFEQRGRGDRHQFRFIVSPEDAAEIGNLRAFTRDLMSRVEADLGTKLDWVAVDHWNTDNPHTHVVLRGRAADRSDLIIARDYISSGMRKRGCETATEWLGPRTEIEIRNGLLREVDQERWTGLDRIIQREASNGTIDLAAEPAHAAARVRRAAMIGRLQRLVAMGLATPSGANSWTIRAGAEDTLRRMGERGDVIRTMQRAMRDDPRELVIENGGSSEPPVVGKIVAKGLADELGHNGYLIVDGIDGRAHYVALASDTNLETLPVGGIVKTRGGTERAADQTIASLATDGLYRTEQHLVIERADTASGRHPETFVAAHVRRLEALRRAGIVERIEDGIWRVPPDLPARGKAYDSHRLGGIAVELESHPPIEQQTRAMGATWLDRQALGDRAALAQTGFGANVHQAMRERETFLVEHGLAERQGQRIVFARDLLATLRNRDVAAAVEKIAADTGLQHQAVKEGQRVSGVYRRSLLLASGRFAMIEEGAGFSLVPWRPVLEKHLGQSVSGVVRGTSVSWEFGRRRGIGL